MVTSFLGSNIIWKNKNKLFVVSTIKKQGMMKKYEYVFLCLLIFIEWCKVWKFLSLKIKTAVKQQTFKCEADIYKSSQFKIQEAYEQAEVFHNTSKICFLPKSAP